MADQTQVSSPPNKLKVTHAFALYQKANPKQFQTHQAHHGKHPLNQ